MISTLPREVGGKLGFSSSLSGKLLQKYMEKYMVQDSFLKDLIYIVFFGGVYVYIVWHSLRGDPW